ncbi:MAG: Rieske (2Fe-2S) protein [Actinomycetota bacterium]|nr:Rieske (2Fe-2S) protein [Actinomycetota bacterium]
MPDQTHPAQDMTASRRAVLAGACGVGVAAVLGGCSTYDSSKGADKTPAKQPAGTALAKTAEVPVGGGKVFAKQAVVVTQPTTGQFKCFTAICTHQGCTVDQVKDGTIDCPCHGSKYHIADGTVANGPAVKGLASKNITVTGDQITLA